MCTIAIIIIQEIWKLSEIIPKKIVDKFASNPLDRIIFNKSFYFKKFNMLNKKLWEFYNCRKQRYTLTAKLSKDMLLEILTSSSAFYYVHRILN